MIVKKHIADVLHKEIRKRKKDIRLHNTYKPIGAPHNRCEKPEEKGAMHRTKAPMDAAQIRDVPLFAPLDATAAEELAGKARALALQKNQLLLKRGCKLDGMYAVMEGTLKIYLLSCNGVERIIRLLAAGDSFGEVIMFNNIPSPVFVQTLSTCKLAYFQRDDVYSMLASQPQFTLSMLRSMSQMMQHLIGDLESCCMQNARQRLAHYLICQTKSVHDKPQVLQLPASKAIIASTLNLSAETFSRELHQLAREGLIAINRRQIQILDADSLKLLAQQGELPQRELLAH